jgi:uncharacterized Zn-binding protein involved in type VI secretion
MPKVTVNAPKTPVTEDSNGLAAATLPNVCKMPGPPAPFVPTPLPNIGKSGTNPKNYSKSVTIEGKKVAIRGATFGSMGDVASKGTGGGVVSSNVEGPTSFVGPGSMDVKIEGKNVQLLGDPMLNNCGPSGSPANAATMMGVLQTTGFVTLVTGQDVCPLCRKTHGSDGSLKETPVTKADAAQLANNLLKKVSANQVPEHELPLARMLGVVQCKCGQKYADHSHVTLKVFCDCIEELGAGWHAPEVGKDPGTTKQKLLDFLTERSKQHEKRLKRIWTDAKELAEESRLGKTSSAAYPPGSCAGPKALMLALKNEAHPVGLTERWFHSDAQPVSAKIKFRDERSGKEVEAQFAHGKSVPPCGTCNLILPLMLCPDDKEAKCPHKT